MKIILITFLLIIFLQPLVLALPANIETTTPDSQAHGYATFQSHNQKVVSNPYGIFMTYVKSANSEYNHNTWRLLRSTDGGTTFNTIYEDTTGTHPPVIETDSNGVIYLIYSDWSLPESDAYLLRFSPSDNFLNPAKTVIPNGAAMKYSMILDEPRQQIYYIATTFNGPTEKFYTIGLDGIIKNNYAITRKGTSADAHYPLLSLDTNDDLYVAWTAVRPGEYTYWSIHFMRSRDGGNTWQKLDGTTLSVPVIADESGPTDRVTLDDEFVPSTWLSSFMVKDGKIHFAYFKDTSPYRQHYVRYDITTAKKDIDIYPEWKGETISVLNLDGFFASYSSLHDSTIYYISRSTDNNLTVIYSDDNGQTWHDYAKKTDAVSGAYYSIGGAREITSDGYIIGSYTDFFQTPEKTAKFIKIKAYLQLKQPVPVTSPGSSRLSATITASASASGYLINNANDNNINTQWVASLTASKSNNNAWVQLDFGKIKQIDVLKWKGGAFTPYPAQSPADYFIQVSNDGIRWVTVARRTNAAGIIDGNEPINQQARYVRLIATKVNDGTGWSLSFFETWAEGAELTSLRSLADKKNIFIGTAVRGNVLEDKWNIRPVYKETVKRDFNLIVPEGDMKFIVIHPNQPGSTNEYDFSLADYIVNFAQANNIKIRGHTLAWCASLPGWINNPSYTKQDLKKILCDHIKTVVGRYKGKIYAWDVVSEVVACNKSGYGNFWMEKIGEEYIEMAFNCAREADPDAKLILEDSDVDGLGEYSDKFYNLVKGLKERGVPIDGVNLEMHIITNYYQPSKEDILANMKRLAALGLEIQIGEMDIRFYNELVNLGKEAQIYGDVLENCLSVPQCKVFSMWGFTDEHSWVIDSFPEQEPLIYDKNYAPKQAYYSIINVLKKWFVDINNDRKVDIADLAAIAQKFGKKSTDSGWNSSYDLVSNNEIDIFDMVYVSSRFT